MDNIERRDREMAYISDDAVFQEQIACRRILQKLNFMDRGDFDGIRAVVKELLGKSEDAFINPPFYCDYGSHIKVGKNFFANYKCCIIDVAKVTFGDYCQMAPNVAIYTAGHPIHPDSRNSAYEYGKAVTIGDNVWIGGNTVICPASPSAATPSSARAVWSPATSPNGPWPPETPAECSGKSPKRTGASCSKMK